jgi:hypothetical protein
MSNECWIIDGKISAIKLVRCFTGLGLRDSKVIVERWMEAFGYTVEYCKTNEPNEIYSLGAMSRGIKSGQWIIGNRDEIIINKIITDEDIRNAR